MIHKHARAGFSLIEIMIAVVILGLVMAVGIPLYYNQVKKTEIKTTKMNLKNLKSQIELFASEIGQLPETLDDLVRKPLNEELAREWINPYMEKIPKDPWGNAFVYRPTPGEERPFVLYSYGPKLKSAPQSEWLDAWSPKQ